MQIHHASEVECGLGQHAEVAREDVFSHVEQGTAHSLRGS